MLGVVGAAEPVELLGLELKGLVLGPELNGLELEELPPNPFAPF